ncbi:MAG: Ig-like domain-containing protein [Acutalibacteraceae bacterium]|nr:Ig-like domain-containing protein [Acutalibacteraceae bacterium]
MKKGKVAITVTIIVVLLLGGTGAFYALSEGTFDPAKLTNLFTEATEPPTEAPTEATEPPTEAPPELSATISSQTLELTQSQTSQITAELKKGDKEKCNIRYSTSDENIASIDAKGLITPMSKGECQVGVYVEGYETTIKNFTVTVSDSRIDQIDILNQYLFSLNAKETYTYAGSKKGNARLTGCKIDDFNNDGIYELFLTYKMANDFQKVQVVTVSGGTAYISQTDKSYSDIVGGGYATYVEDIYTDGNGNINIIAEYTKTDSTYTEKTTLLYSTGTTISQLAKYYSKEPFNINNLTKKSQYKVDETTKTRDEFTSLYSSLKNSRELFDDYISITATLSEGNYTKAELPANLGSAYYNRIKWTTSDDGVAKVSETGVITGGSKVGSCTVTGTIDGITAPLCKVSVEVTAVSNEFNSYIDEIRDDYIIGEAGNKMSLYGYYITDLDADGTTDLLLYYTGGNGCQLEMAHYVGSQVSRQIIKSVTTENGVACMLDLYVDSMNGNSTVLYVGNVSKEGSVMTTDFHYETYSGGTFISNTSEYTVITGSGEDQFKVGGEAVEKDNFNNMLNRYRKLGDWVVL